MATPFLMYHELTAAGRAPCDSSPGYLRYAVDADVFAAQLDWLRDGGYGGVSVSEALANGLDVPQQVALTFDDGCETDLEIAAPLLEERGFGATFFVVSDWVGRPGFMSASQTRRLADLGFDVGSHSCSHAFLSEASDADLRRELSESRRRLEDVTGRAVRHLSCPGGRWSRRVAEAARRAGYESVSTSRAGVNRSGGDSMSLARWALRRETTLPRFQAYCRGERPMTVAVQEVLLNGAKRALGSRLYGGLRNLALRQP